MPNMHRDVYDVMQIDLWFTTKIFYTDKRANI